MGTSQFCLNVTIVDDNEHEGSNPELVTLSPFSSSTPDLISPPFPYVAINIQDNDGVSLYTCIS